MANKDLEDFIRDEIIDFRYLYFSRKNRRKTVDLKLESDAVYWVDADSSVTTTGSNENKDSVATIEFDIDGIVDVNSRDTIDNGLPPALNIAQYRLTGRFSCNFRVRTPRRVEITTPKIKNYRAVLLNPDLDDIPPNERNLLSEALKKKRVAGAFAGGKGRITKRGRRINYLSDEDFEALL